MVSLTNANLDMLKLHKATWGQQFSEAMNVNGGEVETASTFDFIMHFFTFGWKVSTTTLIKNKTKQNKKQ